MPTPAETQPMIPSSVPSSIHRTSTAPILARYASIRLRYEHPARNASILVPDDDTARLTPSNVAIMGEDISTSSSSTTRLTTNSSCSTGPATNAPSSSLFSILATRASVGPVSTCTSTLGHLREYSIKIGGSRSAAVVSIAPIRSWPPGVSLSVITFLASSSNSLMRSA